MFNNNEADMDLSPYVPSTSLGNDLVCNKYGNVMINGKIHNFNNITSYSEFETQLTKGNGYVVLSDDLYGRSSDREFQVKLWENNNNGWIELQFLAWRRNGFGKLKEYNTAYFLRTNGWGPNIGIRGFSMNSTFANSIIAATDRGTYYETGELDFATHRPIVKGRAVGASTAHVYIKAYSRGTGHLGQDSFSYTFY